MRPFLIAGAVVIIDQITKAIALANLRYGESYSIIKKIFHLTLIQNTGAAFGLFKNQTTFFIAVSIIAIIFIIFSLSKRKAGSYLSLALILGGAIGNLIDRIRFGYVVDFLDFRVWPVFNVADSCISIGAFLLFLLLIRGKKISLL
ncbi:MAG: hypothetical protein AMJ78_02720 [Omnitrophica WOR_2 bacterium SM23_29]|nr:MAG: hypothetical protein AMJ78_02720 [Omnitrophica WOR_2 bacterium SM23_29]